MEPAEERALREKVKKRGRAYQCLACYQRLGRTYINEKLKVEDHIYRDHVRPDEVPFYCRLCTFHCQRLDQLMNHVKNYGPHQDQVRRRSIPDEGRAFLVQSKSPYVIGARDYVRLEVEESIQHWMKVARSSQSARAGYPLSVPSTPLPSMPRNTGVSGEIGNTSGPQGVVVSAPALMSDSTSGTGMQGLNSMSTTGGMAGTPSLQGLMQTGVSSNPLAGLLDLPPGWQVITNTAVNPLTTTIQLPVALTEDIRNVVSVPGSTNLQVNLSDPVMTTTQGSQPLDINEVQLSPDVNLDSLPTLSEVQTPVQDELVEWPEGSAEQPMMGPVIVGETVELAGSGEVEEESHDQTVDGPGANDHTYGQEEEDLRPQLLGAEDDTSLASPVKQSSDDGEDPLATVRKRAVSKRTDKVEEDSQGEGFSVDRVALNGLVTVMIGLKEVMEKTCKAVERMDKRLTDCVSEMSKMQDGMYRLRRATEHREIEDSRREERRKYEVQKEQEARQKERDDAREQEDRRKEAERRERGEKRRLEEARKENSPNVRSALVRAYTKNTVRDTSFKSFKRNKFSKNK